MKTQRPKTRRECLYSPRPCPFISCKHHNIWWWLSNQWVFTRKFGSKDAQKQDDAIVELMLSLPETCTLDIVDKYGPITLDFISAVFLNDIKWEFVRQIEIKGIKKLVKTNPKLNKCLEDLEDARKSFALNFTRPHTDCIGTDITNTPLFVNRGASCRNSLIV
jgi:hypothetical protein